MDCFTKRTPIVATFSAIPAENPTMWYCSRPIDNIEFAVMQDKAREMIAENPLSQWLVSVIVELKPNILYLHGKPLQDRHAVRGRGAPRRQV